MPDLEITELNIILSVLGGFLILFCIISSKIKDSWYLGEVLPATVIGILFGPFVAKFIDVTKWASAEPDQQNEITHGVCRVVIGIQLVIVGFQLPAKYQLTRWKEQVVGNLPVMTMMWLSTSVCIFAIIPKVTWMTALVIGSCVACTDPVLSQALVKGHFAEQYVPVHIRDLMSSEAGSNDSFAFPSLMLVTFLIRHVVPAGNAEVESVGGRLAERGEMGRPGGGVGVALKMWFLETWLYTVLLGVVYGATVGYVACLCVKFALRRRWIDGENLLLLPTVIGLFVLGTAGAMGTEELLACFAAGNALNWNGVYQEECNARRDWFNPIICSILNFGGFLYLGSIMPWDQFHTPEFTGITYPRLFALGFAVLVFRRIPATMLSYKLVPQVYSNAKEALFVGYFSPIGIGAIYFVEYTRSLFPELDEGNEEEFNLIAALPPTVYWLVLFSIVIHGLSVPVLAFFYKRLRMPLLHGEPEEVLPYSHTDPFPRYNNSPDSQDTVVAMDEKNVDDFPWGCGAAQRRSAFDDDKRSMEWTEISLEWSDQKHEVKEMV